MMKTENQDLGNFTHMLRH